MFFGLEVKSKEKLSKPMTLTNSVQLSQAVLLPQGAKKEPVCLVVEHDKKEFVLCVLDPSKSWQCPLNLLFESGSQVRFFLRGAGTVHLTGYESFDDLDDISMSMSEDEEITSESDQEDLNKILAKKSPKAKTNGLKSPNKNKEENNDHVNGNEDDDDDDDESDLDFEDSDDEDDDDDDDDQSDEGTDSDDGAKKPMTKKQIRRLSANDLKMMEEAMSDDDSGSDFEVDDDSDDY